MFFSELFFFPTQTRVIETVHRPHDEKRRQQTATTAGVVWSEASNNNHGLCNAGDDEIEWRQAIIFLFVVVLAFLMLSLSFIKDIMASCSDINRLNEKWHIAGALDFERYRLLLPRRSSHTMSPPEVLLPFLKEAGFGDAIQLKDFIFDNTLISAFVERWRPETHTFHLSWGECTITLQDVAYHLGLCTDGEPVGGCMRDFQT
ncbi:protein MAIN-LIKE 2-like [Arachis duranensis]|uniref:Protein MAIN-LIKE 2-like n=1 Tax=Arachis duranensis TaxID=130453 RepID=A0A9C6TWR7_ARADU|nr:protein MAIN-LIKE 2-like [Arachis duranensis]